ncbi:MAG: hypothetical protein ACI4J6_12685 [Oscillospiraceae bacterium]
MRTIGLVKTKPSAPVTNATLEIDGEKMAEKVTEKKPKSAPKAEKADDNA